MPDAHHELHELQDSGPARGPRNGKNGNQDPIMNGMHCRVLGQNEPRSARHGSQKPIIHKCNQLQDSGLAGGPGNVHYGHQDPIINGINCRVLGRILAQMEGNGSKSSIINGINCRILWEMAAFECAKKANNIANIANFHNLLKGGGLEGEFVCTDTPLAFLYKMGKGGREHHGSMGVYALHTGETTITGIYQHATCCRLAPSANRLNANTANSSRRRAEVS